MRRRWRAGLGLVLAIGFVAGGCAGEPLDEDEAEAVDNAFDQAERLGGIEWSDFSQVELQCIEIQLMDIDIAAALADLSPAGDEARAAVPNAVVSCTEDITEIPSYVSQFTASFAAAFAGLDLTDDEGGCLLGHIVDNSPDPGRTIAVGDLPGDVDLLFDGIDRCFSGPNQAVVLGLDSGGVERYGDDPRLDRMYDECGRGNSVVCDVLYFNTVEGTEYDDFALSCGGTGSNVPSCSGLVDVYAADPSAVYVGDGAAVLTASCVAGDMGSCDLLYLTSPFGSPEEDVGFTCDGRIAVGALPDCRTALGETVEAN